MVVYCGKLGGLNVTPGSFAADTDGFDTPPLPMYNSRQPLSNITNLSGRFLY